MSDLKTNVDYLVLAYLRAKTTIDNQSLACTSAVAAANTKLNQLD